MKKLLFLALIAFISLNIKAQTVDLFNGKDLSNWDFVVKDNAVAPEDVFSVQDGVVLIQGQPFGYMFTKEKYADYTLEAEWSWLEKATNSGIFIIMEETTNPFPKTIECQLHAGDAGDFVCLAGADLLEYKTPEGKERPAFPVVAKKQPSNEKPVGEWNKAKIIVKDGKITVYINDVLQNEGTSPVKKGHIGLQSEGGPVQFRNVKLTK
ncbi:MAG: DUF1080 domain-containing protein [Tannerella sp.]|jgi:hypothetical protein|nr:DUF1080 domain-containing protein [Tannerella sp.]